MTVPSEGSPDQKPECAEAPEAPESSSDRRAMRRKTIQFVCVFLLSVFVLLAGYESIKQTRVNDWYLLQVAKSTQFLLNRVGSCTLGDADRFKGKEEGVRAALAKWNEEGDTEALLAPLSNSPGPALTPWEGWSYQAALSRATVLKAERELDALRQDTSTPAQEKFDKIDRTKRRLASLKVKDLGPLVCFTLKPGKAQLATEAKGELASLEASGEGEGPRASELRARIAKLETKLEPGIVDSEAEGLFFNFVLVPDCGAIPSIAIFVAAVLAFPALWRKKLIGIVLGVFILYWVNAFRLMFLATLGAWNHGGQIFKFAHEYVWQGIYIIFVVAVWIAWVELLVRRRSNAQSAANE